ncbi:MAG: hypothetical protein H6819_00085 [Phycisphaerales bacterium]|nr:hypothetical protein [Phycisphaerales bacterium]MCB9857395.1 hypothetical protein [Phycisphaerales bacterium]MCB9864990.1 hypothetical protein [Phycisphaerales bacterium]
MSHLWPIRFRGTLAAAIVIASCIFHAAPTRAADCNQNGIDDLMDVDPADPDGDGVVHDDCNGNGLPDECELGEYETTLAPAAPISNLQFGYDVAIENGIAVVGATGDSDVVSSSGAVHVFRYAGNNWTQETKLKAQDAASGDYFGASVAISNDVILVGAPFDDDSGLSSGAAYVFRHTQGGWQQESKLVAQAASAREQFGGSVSISGDVALIAAIGDDDAGDSAGAAYVFRRIGGTWTQEAKLVSAETISGDTFGASVAIDGDFAVIGASEVDSPLTKCGAAYAFHFDGVGWQQVTRMTASDASAGMRFGASVDVSGDSAIIGTERYWEIGRSASSAYIFRNVNSDWTEEARLTEFDASVDVEFGIGVSIDGDLAVVGARDSYYGSGQNAATYVFRRADDAWTAQAKLTSESLPWQSYFGISVDVSGSHVIASDHFASTGANHSGLTFIFDLIANDCDANSVPDDCDTSDSDPDGDGLISDDCDADGVPDECENDCNRNGVPDDCDIDPSDPDGDGHISDDCNNDGVPNECETSIVDCNGNGVPDDCDIDASDPDGNGAVSTDCNHNGIPDECDVDPADPDRDGLISPDCNANGRPDICECDCNGNGVEDTCDLDPNDPDGDGFSSDDCDANGIPDECDIDGSVLHPFNAGPFIPFGSSVDIDGDFAIVGAMFVGDGFDAGGYAHVLRRIENTWRIEATLTAPDAFAEDRFGATAAISGDTAVVSARDDDDGGISSGAVYVFRRVNQAWEFEAKLNASDAEDYDAFGSAIDIHGDNIIVGAFNKSDAGSQSGAAYVFHRTGTTWHEESKLTASDAAAQFYFGDSVAIHGDAAVIGAIGENSAGSRTGAAYVFRRNGAVWLEELKLQPLNAEAFDNFGGSVSLNGNVLIVGATGLTLPGMRQGTAFVYRNVAGSWQFEATLSRTEGSHGDQFAGQVSISGDLALVGARSHNEIGPGSGVAYLFRRANGVWSELAQLKPAGPASYSSFGEHVSISGHYAIVGRRLSDQLVIDGNSLVSVFDLTPRDCNHNGIVDACDLRGDLTGDGSADLGDLPGFVASLLEGTDCAIADINQDGAIDGRDIQAFAQLLVNP